MVVICFDSIKDEFSEPAVCTTAALASTLTTSAVLPRFNLIVPPLCTRLR